MTFTTQANKLKLSHTQPALIRLEAVHRGILADKSFRQIARELNVDEKTVRRDYQKLLLPPDKQQLILSGSAAEPILREQEIIEKRRQHLRVAAERALKRQRQLMEEQHSGSLSDSLRDSIIEFFGKFNLLPDDIEKIISPVEYRCWFAGDLAEETRVDDYETVQELTKPDMQPVYTFDVITYAANWFYRWLIRAEPTRDIRNSAIVKARQYFERKRRS